MESNKYNKLDLSNVFTKKYGDFTPILNEYFSRMKADLELSDEQINAKVNLFLKNVKKIGFGLLPMEYKGQYNIIMHKIVINVNLFNYEQDYEQIFGMLTHELDHVCNYDDEGVNFGMYRYNKKLKGDFNEQDELLDEIRTDISSTRRVYNDNYLDSEKMIRKTPGYQNYSTFTTMLQNSFGINEKEFIQSSANGRKAFDEKMKLKFVDPKDYYEFMDRFALETSKIFDMRIKKSKNASRNPGDLIRYLEKLRELSYIGVDLRIKKDITDNPYIDIDEYVKNIRYSIEENNKNFDKTIREFDTDNGINRIIKLLNEGNLKDIEVIERNSDNKSNSREQNVIESKIMYLEMLRDNRKLLGDKYNRAIQKVTMINDISELKKYSEVELNLEFKDNSENEFKKELDPIIVERRKSDKENSYDWDNSTVVENVEQLFNKSKDNIINKLLAKYIKIKFKNKSPELGYSKDYPVQYAKPNELKNDICNSIKTENEISDIDRKKLESKNTKELKSEIDER